MYGGPYNGYTKPTMRALAQAVSQVQSAVRKLERAVPEEAQGPLPDTKMGCAPEAVPEELYRPFGPTTKE